MATESRIQDIRRFLEQEKLWIFEGTEDLEDLASQLNLINAFIKNCEEKRDQDDIVRETIRRLTKVAQEAEVVFNYVMLAVEKEKRRNNSEEVLPGWNCISIVGDVAGMARKLTKSIKNIFDDFQQYGISMNVVGHCVRPNTRATFDLLNLVARMRSTERIESSEFTSGDYSWVMVIYLNGNTRDNGTGHVSFYLRLVEKPIGGNSVNASFKFFVLDKHRETYVTIHDGKERKFDAGHIEWGISQALPITDFSDARNGLLVNDSCTFGAEVYVIKNTPTLVCLSKMEERTLRSHTWEVNYFSMLRNETYSPIFPIEGRPWKLCLYPKGHLRGKDKYLSLYLYLEDAADLTSGRKLCVDFVLSIKDQLSGSNDEKSVGFWFDSEKDHHGFDDFLPLTELNNPRKAYKANDTVIIEATINEMFLVTQVG
ncbi:hypothetical protein Ancab_028296 [Ancistrocladus abbreviatus]